MNKIILSFLIIFLNATSFAQNVGIGTNTPDSSALLELNSSNKGFLPPRITTSQRNSITHPAEGLQVFNTTTHCLEMFVYGKWQNVFCGVADTTSIVDSTLLTDIDGHTYPTVKICEQTWMAKNLDVTRYRNGDIIPQVTDPTAWSNLTTGAWCWYNNDSATYGSVYGRLYNWFAVNDPRGLAPEGWHVPSDGEWTTLTDCLGGVDVAGGKMKSTGTQFWISPNTGATNSSGFSALPGGDIEFSTGTFQSIYGAGLFWSNTEYNSSLSISRELYYDRERIEIYNEDKRYTFSIRCVKDAPPPITLNNGLVAYYPFNGNANDESGNGNNGVVNGATLTSDRFGNVNSAFEFQGSHWIECSHNPMLNVGNRSFTISCWAKKYGDNQWQHLVTRNEISAWPNAVGSYALRYEGAGITFISSGNTSTGNGTVVSNSLSNLSDWKHIIGVYNAENSTMSIFINGIQSSSGPISSNPQSYDNTGGLFFGVEHPTVPLPSGPQFLTGTLDDIRIYNRALTQEEISYLAGH